MPVKRPYYGLHQITTGQYTAGGEYILESGEDYVGAYHVLPNGQRFTGGEPNTRSQELFEKRIDLDEMVRNYNQITGREVSKYLSPIFTRPSPTNEDYEAGEIERYFVQKRTSPTNTIVEIDGKQFNGINTQNSKGINGVIWNSLLIVWKISLVDSETAAKLNRQQLIESEESFRGIGRYLADVLEFYK